MLIFEDTTIKLIPYWKILLKISAKQD